MSRTGSTLPLRLSKRCRVGKARILKRAGPGTILKTGSKTASTDDLLEGPRKFKLVDARIVELPHKIPR